MGNSYRPRSMGNWWAASIEQLWVRPAPSVRQTWQALKWHISTEGFEGWENGSGIGLENTRRTRKENGCKGCPRRKDKLNICIARLSLVLILFWNRSCEVRIINKMFYVKNRQFFLHEPKTILQFLPIKCRPILYIVTYPISSQSGSTLALNRLEILSARKWQTCGKAIPGGRWLYLFFMGFRPRTLQSS